MRLLKQQAPTEPLEDDAPFHAAEPQDALRLDLARALESLAPIYRDVLVLVDVTGHTVPEASRTLGIGLETAKSRLHRARALMRQRLLA